MSVTAKLVRKARSILFNTEPHAKTSSCSMSALEGDLLEMILEMLWEESLEDVARFRQVSKFCRNVSERWFFREIALRDTVNGDSTHSANGSVIARLHDHDDPMRSYVRALTIYAPRHSNGTLELLSDESLIQIMANLRNLQLFRWCQRSQLPQRVVKVLRKSWPRAQLWIDFKGPKVKQNTFDVASLKIDADTLPLDQLYCLRFGALINKTQNVSDLPRLREAILQAPNLRKIHIFTRTFHDHIDPLQEAGPYFIPLRPSDKLPPLEEIAITSNEYYMNANHCALWKMCMSWESLRLLDFGENCPQHFFSGLKGCIPNLKFIRLGFSAGSTPEIWTCRNSPEPLQDFFLSFHGLEEIIIRINREDWYPDIWLDIVSHHHGTLRRLEITWHSPVPLDYWNAEDIERFLRLCSRLNDLTIVTPFDFCTKPKKFLKEQVFPLLIETPISRQINLRRLSLAVHVPSTGTPFTYQKFDGSSVLDQAVGANTAISLFVAFFSNPGALLEYLEITFHITDYHRRQLNSILVTLKEKGRLKEPRTISENLFKIVWITSP